MATITAAAGGGNWTATATWTGGVVPTAADDVRLAATSGAVTINAAAVCRSLDCTGYTSTLTHAAVTLRIGDATAGASNVALKLVAGMTYSVSNYNSSGISFVSTSTTQQTIATGGKNICRISISGVGSSYILSDAFTNGTSGSINVYAGTFNTNGQTVISSGGFSSGDSTAKTITLGASTLTVHSWNISNTPPTLNAGSSTITVNGNGANFGGGGLTYNAVALTALSNNILGVNTFATLTRTGTALKTGVFNIYDNQTVTGTLTINGNSAINRMLVQSSATGTPATITAATWSVTNTDFKDITGAGAGSRNLSAITGGSGDCGGNSGFTFTTAATQTANGTTSFSWSDSTRWTSRVPLPQDDVVINIAFGTSQTLTMDMPRLGRSIDFTGTTWTTALTLAMSTATSIFGSLTLVAGLTQSGTSTYTFGGRSTYTLNTAGNTLSRNITFNAPSGTLTLGSNLTLGTTNQLLITSGTFSVSASNYVISAGLLTLSGGTLTLGTATHLITGASATSWDAMGGTLNANTSTIKFTDTSTTAITFVGGGKTYNNVWFSRGASTGDITISETNTFNDFQDTGTAAHSLLFTTGTTQTVTTFSVSGSSASARITLNSTTTGTHALVKSGGGTISCDFLNIQHSVATPSSTWYAGNNSVNNQSVATAGSGWIFTSSVTNTASFLLLMI